MNYEQLVDKFRTMARDILRLRWVSNIKDEVLDINNRLASITTEVASYTKEIARCNYHLSKLEQANPDYTDEKKEDEDRIAEYTKMITRLNEDSVKVAGEKTELTTKIAKVTSDELKVSADNLSAKAKELAEEYMKAQAGLVTE